MNPYHVLNSGLGTPAAAALRARLSAWHDAMVAHERRLRSGVTSDACDDDCPHAEATALWAEAVVAFGARARELTFLRSRATDPGRSISGGESTHERSDAAAYVRRQARTSRSDTRMTPPAASAISATEW